MIDQMRMDNTKRRGKSCKNDLNLAYFTSCKNNLNLAYFTSCKNDLNLAYFTSCKRFQKVFYAKKGCRKFVLLLPQKRFTLNLKIEIVEYKRLFSE